eukprot:355668-Chlamydomonas_euryale.AAC.16
MLGCRGGLSLLAWSGAWVGLQRLAKRWQSQKPIPASATPAGSTVQRAALTRGTPDPGCSPGRTHCQT